MILIVAPLEDKCHTITIKNWEEGQIIGGGDLLFGNFV